MNEKPASEVLEPAAPVQPAALLIDAYSLFFRAYHALPAMNTKSGVPTSALYGFSAVLLKELREQRPRGVAFALDAPQRTFRHEQYAEYKGKRDAVPSPLVAQFSRLRELIDAFGVPRFEVPGFEADDILATLAHGLRQRGEPALILSGDRDLLQLAHGGVRVLFVGARGQKPVAYDAAGVLQRFGVPPEQLPQFAALVGDASDNLPGTPGVGPSTAAKWLTAYGSIEGLLAHTEGVTPVRLRDNLATHAAQIRRNRELATLRADVPLPSGPGWGSISREALARVREFFVELEFKSLLPRLDALSEGLTGP